LRGALERFGEVRRTARRTSPKGGSPTEEYLLNQKQCLYLCTKSDAAHAVEITLAMVEVFDAYLGGRPVALPTQAIQAVRRSQGRSSVAMRTCLTCGQPFRSHGPGNRICPQCKKWVDYRSSALA